MAHQAIGAPKMDTQTRTIQRLIKATTYSAYAKRREQFSSKFNIFRSTFGPDVYYITTKKDQHGFSIAIETSFEPSQLYASIRTFRVNPKGSSFLLSSHRFWLCEPDSIEQFIAGIESAITQAMADIKVGIRQAMADTKVDIHSEVEY